jgi:hypothetical protein
LENLMASERAHQTRKNGNGQSELQVSTRPQFRASNVIAHALALYNLETTRTVSQTMNMALRQFLPAKYIAQAEQLLRNRNGEISSRTPETFSANHRREE